MRWFAVPVAVVLLSAGCASKKYVNRQIGEVDEKVAALTTGLERTQEATGRNEARIEEVDRQAQQGIGEARATASTAIERATEAERAAKGKLLYSVTLSNDKVTFPVNHAQLSEDARQLLDDTVRPIVAENRGVFFEIEGHTDARGPERYNLELGEKRAEAVRNYLRDEHQIALNRIEVISYGESRPVADNRTRENRAMNRRVVVNVLE